MKILVISLRLPHSRVVSGHQIVHQRVKRLAVRGHEVGLAVFAQEDDADHLPELRPMLREIEIVPPPSDVALRGLLRYFISPIPPVFNRAYSPEMFRRVGEMVERTRYDVVLAEFGLMGQYLNRNPYLPAVRKVVSVHHCHSIASRKALGLMGYTPRALRGWLAMKGLQRYELEIFRAADRLLVLTAEELLGMLNVAPDLRATVIPSGVDTDYYRPLGGEEKERALVFTGFYSDEPNRDAMIWFSHNVWPRLKEKFPDLVFYVVGPDPTPAMLELARRDPRIIITGRVEDIRPYLSRSQVFVCPDRMGSGMRGKILQAMASGVPVVATTAAAEGISIQMGDTGFLADRPRIMAQYIDLLLSDSLLRATVATRAREMVVERFSWDRGIDQLEAVLADVAG